MLWLDALRRLLATLFAVGLVTAAANGCDREETPEWNTDVADEGPFDPCAKAEVDTIEECNAERADRCADHGDEASCRAEPWWDIGPDVGLRCGWVEARRIIDDTTCESIAAPGFCALLFQAIPDICAPRCAVDEAFGGLTLSVDLDARTVFHIDCGPEGRTLGGPIVGAPFPGYASPEGCSGGFGPDYCRCAQAVCEAGDF